MNPRRGGGAAPNALPVFSSSSLLWLLRGPNVALWDFVTVVGEDVEVAALEEDDADVVVVGVGLGDELEVEGEAFVDVVGGGLVGTGLDGDVVGSELVVEADEDEGGGELEVGVVELEGVGEGVVVSGVVVGSVEVVEFVGSSVVVLVGVVGSVGEGDSAGEGVGVCPPPGAASSTTPEANARTRNTPNTRRVDGEGRDGNEVFIIAFTRTTRPPENARSILAEG